MAVDAATEPPRGVPMVASHRVAAHLRAEIIGGKLSPGERIMQEELAARFGSSRLPVREALRILESEGLVTLRSNSGAWVAKIDRQECLDIYKIRECVEPLAVAESMPNLRTIDIQRLESIQAEIDLGTDVERFLNLDRELHLLTYSGCRIEPLNAMVERFWNTTQHYRRAYTTAIGRDRRWMINAEHRLLIEAIKQVDIDGAKTIVWSHIRRTRLELTSHLFDDSGTALWGGPDIAKG
jgi:DNA-binding GntR family transcriptional regulator